MAVLTKHGRQRIAERVGVSGDHAAGKNTKCAYQQGIRLDETTGELRQWCFSKLTGHRGRYELRIYRGNLYIFKGPALVTVYPIPEEIDAILEENTQLSAYHRYRTSIQDRELSKSEKENKKYQEKKREFIKQVELNEIRSQVKGRFPVKITGIRTEENFITVFYIPDEYTWPDLNELGYYIRNTMGYGRVKFDHVRGADGKKKFNRKFNFDPYEDEVVYSI